MNITAITDCDNLAFSFHNVKPSSVDFFLLKLAYTIMTQISKLTKYTVFFLTQHNHHNFDALENSI